MVKLGNNSQQGGGGGRKKSQSYHVSLGNFLGIGGVKNFHKVPKFIKRITRRTTGAKGNYFLQVFTIFYKYYRASIFERVSFKHIRASIISGSIRQYQAVSLGIRQYQAVSVSIGQYQAVSGIIIQYQVVSGIIRQYQAVSDSIWQYQAVSVNIWQYQAVSGSIG